MSDLGGGGTDYGHGASAAGSRAAAGDVPVSKPSSSGLRTPRDIMNERNAREARRRAEAEREQAEQAVRAAEEAERRRRSADRRSVAAAGVADVRRGESGNSGHRRSQTIPAVSGAEQYQPSVSREGERYGESGRRPATSGGRMPESERVLASNVPTSRYRSAAVAQDQARPVSNQPAPLSARVPASSGLRMSSAPASSTAPPVQEPEPQSTRGNSSSFPHAFERWEQLSSHWEGLTSYWLHKLEMNTEEIGRNVPSAAALSRQINDLSAAGANLFHAVVELQRLRASSERKFQRWFFETRNEQEHAQEDRARLENALQNERAARADALARANIAEQEKRNADKMVSEIRRELLISKEEARRAWEELGRKEHEERELIISLREGAPTTIGGVQVVPTQFSAGASRHDSDRRPTTSEGPSHQGQRQRPEAAEYDDAPSPTDTDPFTESNRARQPQPAPQSQSGGVYQPYPLGSTPATSGSTAPTVIPPQHRQRAVSPLQSEIRSAPVIASSSPRPVVPGPSVRPGSPHGSKLQPTVEDETSPESFYRHPPTQSFLHSPQSSTSTTQPVLPAAPPPPVPQEQSLREQASYTSSHTSEETEYEIDQHGNLRLDAQGRPIILHSSSRRAQQPSAVSGLPATVTVRRGPSADPAATHGARSEESDDYPSAADDPADVARERELPAQYMRAPSPPEAPSLPETSAAAMASAQQTAGAAFAEPADYEGSGYEGWVGSRHHHPTRLSDVLEEDERSRTTGE